MYEYRCKLLKLVDADTFWLNIDLGFDTWMRISVRLNGVNAPERNTPAGKAAMEYVRSALAGYEDAGLVVRTFKDAKEKYGRYLADFVLPDGSLLTGWMLAYDHAVAYSGGKR